VACALALARFGARLWARAHLGLWAIWARARAGLGPFGPCMASVWARAHLGLGPFGPGPVQAQDHLGPAAQFGPIAWALPI